MTRPEIQALIAAPDRSKWTGRRDHTCLLTLYNSGARVSEIITLKRDQVSFGASTFVQLTGKGRTERVIPLWSETAQMLKSWFRELGESVAGPTFPNAWGKPMSRHSVDYLFQQAVQRAIDSCPSLATKTISPHVVRHTTAMHLLPAGVDLATIALWRGHENIETTHMYLEADLAMKEKALGKLEPIASEWRRFQADDPLLAFLSSL